MFSSLSGNLMIVKNRGEPMFWDGKNEREVQEFKSFETSITGESSRFLQILENKL